MIAMDTCRRFAGRWGAAAVGVLALAAAQPSHAITVGDCANPWRTYLGALETFYDGDVPDEDVADVLTTGAVNLAFINSIDDPENLSESAKAWRSTGSEPNAEPSDYDKVSAARRAMIICMYEERLAEVQGSDGDNSPTPSEPVRAPEEPKEDLSSPPTPIAASQPWFLGEDFPTSAVRDGRHGLVKYTLTVDATGGVAGCQADGPEGSSDLERATCDAVMARAKFNPATDRSGAPVVGEFEASVTWTLPD